MIRNHQKSFLNTENVILDPDMALESNPILILSWDGGVECA